MLYAHKNMAFGAYPAIPGMHPKHTRLYYVLLLIAFTFVAEERPMTLQQLHMNPYVCVCMCARPEDIL